MLAVFISISTGRNLITQSDLEPLPRGRPAPRREPGGAIGETRRVYLTSDEGGRRRGAWRGRAGRRDGRKNPGIKRGASSRMTLLNSIPDCPHTQSHIAGSQAFPEPI